MKPPFYEIATIHEKNRDGTFRTYCVVTTPTHETESFHTLEEAREFVRVDQIPTPKPTVEQIKAKAKRIDKAAIIVEETERTEELKLIESRQFWEKIQLSALLMAIAIVIVHVFLS